MNIIHDTLLATSTCSLECRRDAGYARDYPHRHKIRTSGHGRQTYSYKKATEKELDQGPCPGALGVLQFT